MGVLLKKAHLLYSLNLRTGRMSCFKTETKVGMDLLFTSMETIEFDGKKELHVKYSTRTKDEIKFLYSMRKGI